MQRKPQRRRQSRKDVYKRQIQSLRGAAPYAKNGAQANTITADTPKNKEAAYGWRKTHEWRL